MTRYVERFDAEVAARKARDELVQEVIEKEREVRRGRVKRALLLGFVVEREPARAARFVVRRADVYAHVARELGEPIVRPSLMAEVADVAEELGAVEIMKGNRALYRGLRRAGASEAEAESESRRCRRRANGVSRGRGGRRGRGRPTDPAAWETLLAAEGMPREVKALSGKGRLREVANRALREMGDRPSPEPPPETSARAEINAAAQARAESLLEAIEEERAILRLTVEGLSIRQVAARLDMHRASVHRVLLRVRARVERDIAPEDEADPVEHGPPEDRSVNDPATRRDRR